jgi:hypothetical protein
MVARSATLAQEINLLTNAMAGERRIRQERLPQIQTAAYGVCNLLYMHH